MFTKGQFTDSYNKTQRIDVTNKKIKLKEDKENQNIPYHNFSQIQLRLCDSAGEGGTEGNAKFFSGMKKS